MSNTIVPPSQIPASHSVPQIRSRITVVCAECKRLKLKCDRRNPCGSCTKRDTVARCIYSPAAAEKVDLHSLNNRLIQVEATLSLMTSTQSPPVFQSSYPYSQVPSSSGVIPTARTVAQVPTSPQHQHHHHNSAPLHSSNAFISLSTKDLSNSWLDELASTDLPLLNVQLPYPCKADADSVKLETTMNGELTDILSNAFDHNATLTQGTQTNTPHVYLPPLSAYYAASEQCPEVCPQGSASTSYIPPQPQTSGGTSKPTVTPTLVTLLPSLARTKQLLRNAARILREWPAPLPACLLSSLSNGAGTDADGSKKGKGKACLPSLATHWDAFEFRAICLVGSRGVSSGSTTKLVNRKEREKMSARAKAIFFGGGASPASPVGDTPSRQRTESQTPKTSAESEGDSTERTTKERGETLPFFAALCILLAFGTADSKSSDNLRDDTGSPEFLFALAQQSLTVWEQSATTFSDDKEVSRTEEDERLDYLVASLLGVEYQLFEPRTKPKGKDSQRRRFRALNKAFTSVGKMVNIARAMGLEKERKMPMRCKEEGSSTGALNVRETSVGKDGKKKVKAGEKRRRREDLRRLIWWDIVCYEIFISDALGHDSLLSGSSCPVKLPHCAGSLLHPDEVVSERDNGQQASTNEGHQECEVHEVLERYHGARCRLTKITQMIKQKLAHPDCCCGYTLDQAATLEGEVSHFLEGLPPLLRVAFNEEDVKANTVTRYQDPHPSNTDEAQKDSLRSQSCELVIMAQRLIIMAYLPFLQQPSASDHLGSTTTSIQSQISDDSAWNFALQPVLNAAQCTIRASKALLQSGTSIEQWITPPLLDLYPMEKAVLDAVIICVHAGTFHGTLFSCRHAAAHASLGLEILLGQDLDPESKILFQRIKKRFHVTICTPESLVHGVKRKHELIGLASSSRDAEGTRDEANPSYPDSGAAGRLTQVPTEKYPSASLEAPKVSNGETACSGRDPETGQKVKKHAKKGHSYPSVGIRVRNRKEGLPPFLKNRLDSTSMSVPSPGQESRTQNPRLDGGMQSSLLSTPVGDEPQRALSPQGTFKPVRQSSRMDPSPRVMSSLLDDSQYPSSSSSQSQELHRHHEPRQPVTYTTSYSDMYEQGQELSPEGSQMNSGPSADSFERSEDNNASNAFNHIQQVPGAVESNHYGSSNHLSSSETSPYLASGGTIIPMTSFGQVARSVISHRPTTSPYAQDMTTSSNSHTYYHVRTEESFNGICDRSEESHYTDIGLETTDGTSTGVMRGDGGSAGLAYEKIQPTIYDIKTPMNELMQSHAHHPILQHSPYDVDQRHLHALSLGQSAQSWPPQQATTDSCSPRFWAPAAVAEYKYMH